MIDHNITNRITTYCIISSAYPRFTATETHITNDDIMCVDPNSFAGNTNTIARSCLTCNGNIRCTDYYRRLNADNSGNIKYNYSCATLLASPTKTSLAIV